LFLQQQFRFRVAKTRLRGRTFLQLHVHKVLLLREVKTQALKVNENFLPLLQPLLNVPVMDLAENRVYMISGNI